MPKAIGFIACVSVMAASLYLFSGGDPSRTLSAQTESANADGYGSAARKFLNDARRLASEGNIEEARRLAETAASLSSDWQPGEQTPQDFLKSLNSTSGQGWSVTDDVDWSDLEPGAGDPAADNPFAAAATPAATPAVPKTGAELLKKRQAQQLLQEARKALTAGNIAEARTRAMQARQLNVAWGLWDERPEHVLAEIDGTEGTETFLTRQHPAAAQSARSQQDDTWKQATALLQQARAQIDSGNLQAAEQLAAQADSLQAAYGMFDDSPELVRRDIARLQSFEQVPAVIPGGAQPQQTVTAETARARDLLRNARAALTEGRLSAARDLAVEAQRLNVTYHVLDDRPELILADIDRALGGRAQQELSGSHTAAVTGTSAVQPNARELVAQARDALTFGDLETARRLALQAQQQDVAFGVMEDRPEVILEEADLKARQQMPSAQSNAITHGKPVDVTPAGTPAWPQDEFASSVASSDFERNETPVINPEGLSADEAYQQGLALLRSDNRPAARAAFLHAWKNAGQLDNYKRQQLQDFLQELASERPSGLRLVSAQETDDIDLSAGLRPLAASDQAATAAGEHDVRYDRLRTEVMNSVFRAEKLKEQNPSGALEILDRTMASVDGAELSEEATATLTGYVQRSQNGIRTYMEQRAPQIALADRNRNTKEKIERDIKNQIRIEQEFGELTDQFNDLMRQRRYAEAELIAQKAFDLNPSLPQAVIMVQKVKLQKQIDLIEDIKTKSADRNLEQFNDIELAMTLPRGDYALPDAKTWADMKKGRARFGRADARELTPSELLIEKSLGEQISLHFHDVPMTEVIKHIASVHGINIALDTRAIEAEGISPSQPVSIDVDGITLRSALNLLLAQAGGLVFSVKDEVLMITNRLEEDNRLEPRAYNVADLVVPMGLPDAQSPFGGSLQGNPGNNSFGGNGLFQVQDDLAVSINGTGRPRGGIQAGSDRGIDFSGLTDLIMSTIEPGTWVVDGGAGDITGHENTLSLVIRQTPAVHDEIGDLLAQLRKLQDLQVTVEVRFISVTDRFFERIGVDFDFNVQDNVGDPPGVPAFGSRQLTFPGGGGAGDLRGGQQGQAGGQGGGGAGGGQGGVGGIGGGGVGGGGQGGVGGQQGQQGGQQGVATGLFDTVTRVNAPRDDFNGTIAGLSAPGQFTQDYDIQFRQGSFEIGVPDFGNFNPDAGIQVGMAILSDIEAFFFIQAAQADERSNVLFAPKVTLFNGQLATISDQTQRPFVQGLQANVGTGAVGFTPILGQINDGISLSVGAVISADRRFVRLSLAPQFQNLIDLQTFSFANGGAGGGAAFGGGGGGGFGGQQGGGGGGFGGQQGGFGGIGGGFGGGGGGQGGFGGGGGGGVGGQQGQQGQQGGGGVGALTVQQPIIETISVSTIVSVPDGGTVLLGGIKRLREGRNMAGVPILNKIPYISRLFKNSGVGRETESVMLMVTPRIIIHEEEEELILGTSAQ